MANPFIGEVRLVGFNFAPQGWATCDGQLLPISENVALFSLLGTTYGGDGVTTFGLPDLQSRIPVHQGNTFIIGQKGGSETVTLTGAQVPSHTHPLIGSTDTAVSRSPVGNVPAASTRQVYGAGTAAPLSASALSAAGGNLPHDNLQPFQCVSYIISLFGIFPSQN